MKRGPSISQAQSLHHAMKDLEAQTAIEATPGSKPWTRKQTRRPT